MTIVENVTFIRGLRKTNYKVKKVTNKTKKDDCDSSQTISSHDYEELNGDEEIVSHLHQE